MAGPALRGFPPVIDRHIRTLILGSFPSEKSLAKGQYYGHPQNQFWRLLGHIIDRPLHEMPYQERLESLLVRRIGLWDVIGTCERTGSLDSAIRNAAHNRFGRVTRVAKGLRRVCFNGKTAGELEPWFAEQGYETLVLPSSSPANTMRFPTKLRLWRKALTRGRRVRKPIAGHRSRVTGHLSSC
jgi:hypoxanthine-DNA glycosylase